jgi:hypothetical protein
MKRLSLLSLLACTSFLLASCDAADKKANCGAELGARLEALGTAADALVEVSGTLTTDVFAACNAVAVDLGGTAITPAAAGAPTDDEVNMACAAATAKIDAEVTAGATISVVVVGGQCTVNAEAQFECEANCDVSGTCTPGSVEVRCDPGELSVKCEGMCSASASCEADVAIACEGQCSGKCEGTCTGSCEGTAECTGTCAGKCTGECSGSTDEDGNCDGNCMGTCEGTCSASVSCEGECQATCEGECTGSCQLDAAVECDAEARCKGGCEGTATAPKCEGEFMPPECDINADCKAGCDGQASFEATCTEPTVEVLVTGGVDGDLATTLSTNLPILLNVVFSGQLYLESAGDVATAFGEAVVEAGEIPACAVSVGADFVAAASASVKASASVSVSVSASASVAGSAGAM